MCDFRKITKIKLKDQEIPIEKEIVINVQEFYKDTGEWAWADDFTGKNLKIKLEKGFYHFVATGSRHLYYDGEQFYRERNTYYPNLDSPDKEYFEAVEFTQEFPHQHN